MTALSTPAPEDTNTRSFQGLLDVENARNNLLTLSSRVGIMLLLLRHGFARSVEGTEARTVRKDCLGFLFLVFVAYW